MKTNKARVEHLTPEQTVQYRARDAYFTALDAAKDAAQDFILGTGAAKAQALSNAMDALKAAATVRALTDPQFKSPLA